MYPTISAFQTTPIFRAGKRVMITRSFVGCACRAWFDTHPCLVCIRVRGMRAKGEIVEIIFRSFFPTLWCYLCIRRVFIFYAHEMKVSFLEKIVLRVCVCVWERVCVWGSWLRGLDSSYLLIILFFLLLFLFAWLRCCCTVHTYIYSYIHSFIHTFACHYPSPSPFLLHKTASDPKAPTEPSTTAP